MNAGQTPTDHAALETSAFAPAGRLTIQDASAWILRIGVVTSVVVMLAGLTLSFVHHPVAVQQMQHAAFDGNLGHLWQGLRDLRGQAVIELGIYLLVFTPILRVVTSMVLFLVEEHDVLYTVVTFFVFVLTLTGLLLLK
ncbi:MAG TPA: DUF1634 domain-containing protein [Vicinamibacterales bacterium]|nr:DUF1634 domain-containing protein [Vicinamibacterales bacterium]